jgi:hypothetical protein
MAQVLLPRPKRTQGDAIAQLLSIAGTFYNIKNAKAASARAEQEFKLGQEVKQEQLAALKREKAEQSALARGVITPTRQSKLLESGVQFREAQKGAPGAMALVEPVTDERTGEVLGERPTKFVSLVTPGQRKEERQVKVDEAKQRLYAAQVDKLNKEMETLTLGDVPGIRRKDIKDSQWQAAKTAVRQEASEKIIEDLAKKGFDFGGFETALVEAGKDSEGRPLVRFAAKNIQSPDQRAYATAAWNWITAQLRQESGAAIAASEFETEFNTFFPSVGADPQTINLKAQERARKMGGNIAQAGENVFQHAKDVGERFASSVFKLPTPKLDKLAERERGRERAGGGVSRDYIINLNLLNEMAQERDAIGQATFSE